MELRDNIKQPAPSSTTLLGCHGKYSFEEHSNGLPIILLYPRNLIGSVSWRTTECHGSGCSGEELGILADTISDRPNALTLRLAAGRNCPNSIDSPCFLCYWSRRFWRLFSRTAIGSRDAEFCKSLPKPPRRPGHNVYQERDPVWYRTDQPIFMPRALLWPILTHRVLTGQEGQ